MEQQPFEWGGRKMNTDEDFCEKLGGLTISQNTADDGSALNFGRDTGFCLTRLRIEDPERRSVH